MRTLRIGRVDEVPEYLVCLQAANGKSLFFDLENGEIHILDDHVPRQKDTADIIIGPVNLQFAEHEMPCPTPK